MPASEKERWDSAINSRLKVLTPDEAANWKTNWKRVFQKHLEIVRLMHRAGVEFLAGSDFTVPYIYPGFSLHEELALMVEAGFKPLEALQTATINPAKFFGMLNSLGTVEKGKTADLVLLEANPLEDIDNTQKINAVVANGKLIPK